MKWQLFENALSRVGNVKVNSVHQGIENKINFLNIFEITNIENSLLRN